MYELVPASLAAEHTTKGDIMSVVNKFVNFMSLNNDDDDEYEEGYEENSGYLDEGYDNTPAFETVPEPEKEYEAPKAAKRYSSSSNKVAPMKNRRSSNMNLGSGLEVCVIKPVSIDEARTVTETLLQNRAVVLNLEGIDVEIAQRIIDFTSGSCYAINGNLQKISNYIFIITPQTVEISGDFQDIFGGSGSNSDVTTF